MICVTMFTYCFALKHSYLQSNFLNLILCIIFIPLCLQASHTVKSKWENLSLTGEDKLGIDSLY